MRVILGVAELGECRRWEIRGYHLLSRSEQPLRLREITVRRVVSDHGRGHVELLCCLVDVLEEAALVCCLSMLHVMIVCLVS